MKKEIVLDGKKYRLVNEEDEVKSDDLNGYGGIAFIFVSSSALMVVSLFSQKWLTAISFLLIMLIIVYMGFDMISDLKKRIDAKA